MGQKFSQVCSESTKPLLFVGSFLTMLAAFVLGYTGLSARDLYGDLGETEIQKNYPCMILQLGATAYLVLMTVFSAIAAHYDQKHSIRVLSIISTVNFVLAIIALMMMPTDNAMVQSVESTLKDALGRYDFRDPPKLIDTKPNLPSVVDISNGTVGEAGKPRPQRFANSTDSQPAKTIPTTMDSKEATLMWDRLQARLCCGLNQASQDWKDRLPKSCCAEPKKINDDFVCEKVDESHNRGCIGVIAATNRDIWISLALVLLANLYVAIISGLSVYRTLNYDEASQNAYN